MNKQPTERTSNRENKQLAEQAAGRTKQPMENKATDGEQSNRWRTKQPMENKYILKEKATATDGDYIKQKNKIKKQNITLRFHS
jgi:hypothetical protein